MTTPNTRHHATLYVGDFLRYAAPSLTVLAFVAAFSRGGPADILTPLLLIFGIILMVRWIGGHLIQYAEERLPAAAVGAPLPLWWVIALKVITVAATLGVLLTLAAGDQTGTWGSPLALAPAMMAVLLVLAPALDLRALVRVVLFPAPGAVRNLAVAVVGDVVFLVAGSALVGVEFSVLAQMVLIVLGFFFVARAGWALASGKSPVGALAY